jgi:hypothetical protein
MIGLNRGRETVMPTFRTANPKRMTSGLGF